MAFTSMVTVTLKVVAAFAATLAFTLQDDVVVPHSINGSCSAMMGFLTCLTVLLQITTGTAC